jgi:hypothetical protein
MDRLYLYNTVNTEIAQHDFKSYNQKIAEINSSFN